MAKANQCSISPEQAEQQLNSTLDSADPLRAQSLVRLRRTREVKLKGQEREKIRLTAKLGENHTRVQSLQTKVDQNKVFIRTLRVESDRAQTEAPVVESDSWLVHGRVLNDRLEAVPGMKAALYDRSGCPIQTCGSEITDKTGYFKLTIKNVADGAQATAATNENIVDDARAAAAINTNISDDAGDTAATNENMDGFLYVLDKDDVTVHRDKRPLAILAGQAQYLEVVLDDGDVDRPTQPKTRYLGNSNSRELHDLNNQKPACQIDEIRVDHRINFKTQKEAVAMGYDYCAYCFGKEKSKR
jgi:hypothetical protein